MSEKKIDPTETVEEKRIRMINERDEEIASLRKTIGRLRRINSELAAKLKPRSK
jgi:hypothetical protein